MRDICEMFDKYSFVIYNTHRFNAGVSMEMENVPEVIKVTKEEEERLASGGTTDDGLVPGLMGEFC